MNCSYLQCEGQCEGQEEGKNLGRNKCTLHSWPRSSEMSDCRRSHQ